MKIWNRMILVYRSITQRVFVTLLLLVMCITSFYMIDTVLMNYMTDAYLIDKVESTFGVEPNRVSYVRCLDSDDATIEMSDKLKEYLDNHSDVEACGYYTVNATIDLWEEEGITMVIAEPELIGMGNLKLTDEQRDKIVDYPGDYEPALLGCNYKDVVNVGDVFTLSLYEEKTCIVAGFLEKGASWPKGQGMFNGASNLDSYTLDNQGILITDKFEDYNNFMGSAMDVYYIAKEDKAHEVASDVRRFAVKNTISVAVTNQGEDICKELEENSITADKTFVAAVLLVLLAIVSMAITSIVYCLLNKKQYGVMMVSGVRRQEIEWMVIVQNALTLVASAVVAWIVRQYEIFGTLITRPTQEDVLFLYIPQYVCHHYYLPILFVVSIVMMVVITSILPVMFIRKMSLVELVHGRT